MEDLPEEEQDVTGLSRYGAGLQNLGNTCYMNSTLQCFYGVGELRAAVDAHAPPPAEGGQVAHRWGANRLDARGVLASLGIRDSSKCREGQTLTNARAKTGCPQARGAGARVQSWSTRTGLFPTSTTAARRTGAALSAHTAAGLKLAPAPAKTGGIGPD